MENETVGVIAELLLLGDVQHDSAVKTIAVDQEIVSGAQNQGAAGMGNTRSNALSLNPQKVRKDDDEGPEDEHPQIIQTEDENQNILAYPAWLHKLHERAQEKSVQLIFSNSDITQSEQGRYLSSVIEWHNSISQPTTPARQR